MREKAGEVGEEEGGGEAEVEVEEERGEGEGGVEEGEEEWEGGEELGEEVEKDAKAGREGETSGHPWSP